MIIRNCFAASLAATLMVAAVYAQAPAVGAPEMPPQMVLAPVLAQDVYKNVEIFRDKPATSVLPAMDGLRHVLGVDCSWCHKLYEWEKDDIKPKQTARQMFHMVDFIDTTMFDGKERVNCWTCHRSRPVPPTLAKVENPPEQVAAQMFIRFKPEQADKPVEQVFHNIRVLRGIPAKQLPETMAYVSRALGVRCMFCHNLDDFSSDEKEPKRTARKMFAMVEGISKNFYNGGETPVECYNCHQGHEQPPEGVPPGLLESLHALPFPAASASK
jgi:hypothetical protein